MTRSRKYGDAGQAFPIYITVVGGLLFLALAYFAVGQATVNRGGAQTAADAAALAAAQDARDQLAGEWVEAVLDPAKWQDIFDGDVQLVGDPCARADQLAGRNDADVQGCSATGLPLGYEVVVQTRKPMGESIVPVTAQKRSRASATAVIQSLCDFKPLAEDAGDDVLPRLTCDGRNWDLKPDDLTELPEPEDLFDVHLAD
ncbi:pilus assembly protein TadG-related protein [Streptomyces sp. 378]|uniref:pilus assembly protein TadG-related protein n=1 Tax=Streptomyces sp. 378 TaxID=3049412 RepID=UPI0024C3CCD7|nr:pilus assembly protein TadG-related protein [Streptomyces sp. 378]MDK1343359.1 pilus assembly protein TadG-related protein [Streptomyces sp. 378]